MLGWSKTGEAQAAQQEHDAQLVEDLGFLNDNPNYLAECIRAGHDTRNEQDNE